MLYKFFKIIHLSSLKRRQEMKFLNHEKLKKIYKKVKFIDIKNVYIEAGVEIGYHTVIYPQVFLYWGVKIGEYCTIKPFVSIKNSYIGESCIVKEHTEITDSYIKGFCNIGPYSHIHDKCELEIQVEIAHSEIVRSKIEKGTKIKHYSYIGDAEIGQNCNIGAGTVFCNYDGIKKNKSVVRDNVFIGSGVMIIAPITIYEYSFIAAGSVVSKDVPPNTLLIARGQAHKHPIDLQNGNTMKSGGAVYKREYIKK